MRHGQNRPDKPVPQPYLLLTPLHIGDDRGHPGTKETNARLARAAERYGIGMGVGSQRAALENPSLADTFSVVRDSAPRAFLVANLGVVQLRDHGIEWAEQAVEMIEADAIAIHLNFLQEAIQPEGDHNAIGCFAAIEELARHFKKPVIVKETGCGSLPQRHAGAGVRVSAPSIPVAGAGRPGRQSRASGQPRAAMQGIRNSGCWERTLLPGESPRLSASPKCSPPAAR